MLRLFCNYLRGKSTESSYSTDSVYEKVLSLKKFFKYIGLFLRLIFPKFLCASTFLALFLLIDVVVLEVVIYQVGLLGGKFYKSLTNKDLDDFRNLAFLAIGLILLDSLMVSLQDFVAQLLGIVWRKYITLKLHELYFTKKNFYYLQQPIFSKSYKRSNDVNKNSFFPMNLSNDQSESINSMNTAHSTSILLEDSVVPKIANIRNKEANPEKRTLDNPDQRITQDVNTLCKSFSSILPVIFVSPFVIGWYTYQTYVNVGYFGPLTVFVYFLIWSLINGPLTRPIIKVVYNQDRKEGDFRFKHMNLRTNAESIAFYDSSENELWSINQHFNKLLDISYKRNWKEFILKCFVNTSKLMGGIIAYLVLGIPIFTNMYSDKKPAELAQFISNYSFKCQYLIYLFTRLYTTLDDISSIVGNCHRVGELFYRLKTNIKTTQSKEQNLLSTSDNSVLDSNICFEVKNLNVLVPDKSKILVRNLSFRFERNVNYLVTGKSGCGKTSLLRTINGLWSSYTGDLILSKVLKNEFFFIPQNSYFTSGSLMEQIIYPKIETELLSKSTQDEINSYKLKIHTWLRKFNLEHLMNKISFDLFFKPEFNWSTVLSAGEQQRLSFLRVLFHKPNFVLLDEFTSSVDQETEALMYESLLEINTTFLSIAHRDTVRKYHHREIRINTDTTCEILDIQ